MTTKELEEVVCTEFELSWRHSD